MTAIAELSFDDGAQINVVKVDETYTYVCSKFDRQEHGVMLEYTDSGTTYRVLVPYHMIDRVFQEV